MAITEKDHIMEFSLQMGVFGFVFICILYCFMQMSNVQNCVIWFFLCRWRYIQARKTYYKILADSSNFTQLQKNLLRDILKTNTETEYGRRCNFSKIVTREEWARSQPIMTSYENVRHEMERMAKGEQNVLTSFKFNMFGTSSGTTGKTKMIPCTNDTIQMYDSAITMTSVYLRALYTRNFDVSAKTMVISFVAKKQRTEGGHWYGPISSFIAASNNSTMATALPPFANLSSLREPDVLYLILLFALKDRNLELIMTFTGSMLWNAFSTLEAKWNVLVRDVHRGRITELLQINERVRRDIEFELRPDQKRAYELELAVQQGGFRGIIRRIWPKLGLILAVTSGPFEMYGDMMRNSYAKGVPILSFIYGASEGMIGLNLHDFTMPSYMLLNNVFYEFEEVQENEQVDDKSPKILFSDQLTQGEKYELIITNKCGLYRYATSDIIKVLRYEGEAPVFQFLYRRGQALSLRMEKTTELAITISFNEAIKSVGNVELVDFTTTESGRLPRNLILLSSGPASYVALVETKIEMTKEQIIKLQNAFDQRLRTNAPRYDFYRSRNGISPPVVYQVNSGAFLRYRDVRANAVGSSFQYKSPKVILTKEPIDFFCNEILLHKKHE